MDKSGSSWMLASCGESGVVSKSVGDAVVPGELIAVLESSGNGDDSEASASGFSGDGTLR